MGKKAEGKNRDLKKKNKKLEDVLNNGTSNGLLPVCALCKKIRDDKGYWHQVEASVQTLPDAKLSHGLCPECFKKMYPDFEEMKAKNHKHKKKP